MMVIAVVFVVGLVSKSLVQVDLVDSDKFHIYLLFRLQYDILNRKAAKDAKVMALGDGFEFFE
jgi:hypothetical protein